MAYKDTGNCIQTNLDCCEGRVIIYRYIGERIEGHKPDCTFALMRLTAQGIQRNAGDKTPIIFQSRFNPVK